MIKSRAMLQAGEPATAVALARQARDLAPESVLATLNLASLLIMSGYLGEGLEVAQTVPREALDPVLGEIADSTEAMVTLGRAGNLAAFVAQATAMAERQAAGGLRHYEGISLLNAAICLRAQGDGSRCLELSTRAIDLLEASGASYEATSACLAKAWALAHLGMWAQATSQLAALDVPRDGDLREEVLGEAATVHVWYGDETRAAELLSAALALEGEGSQSQITRLVAAELAIRQGDGRRASELLGPLSGSELNREPAFRAHVLAVKGYANVIFNLGGGNTFLVQAMESAEVQVAQFWVAYCALVLALADEQAESAALPSTVRTDPSYLSVVAELVATRLHALDKDDLAAVVAEAARRPLRWRPVLRSVALRQASASRWHCAEVLDMIGERTDVGLLREIAKSARPGRPTRSLGRGLARRLAPKVFIEDQGRVRLFLGSTLLDGSAVRRKVLALLCFLITRTSFAATRDEVLDALWPDLDPEVAVNSLNQTVYFLRRVFEPEYQESTSPGYLQFDSNVLWLDAELVDARSARCLSLIRSFDGSPSPDEVQELVETYAGRFALDFAYDEWSIPYRDTLHAAYLQVVEAAVTADTANGHYGRGIQIARAALEVDATAEPLENCLVRLYRLSGAHAAAAEQYEHYAAVVREELGVDPPTLEAL
jgi:DNA-binding SARP family transcriptional activator